MAEKFWLKSLSSFSRSSMERCFTLLCSRSLSAASILAAAWCERRMMWKVKTLFRRNEACA